MSDNPTEYEVLIEQYLRPILDISESCCSPQGLAHARANDNQHPKHSRLQQQVETGGLWDETWSKQRGEFRHKKVGVTLMEGGPSKIKKPANLETAHENN